MAKPRQARGFFVLATWPRLEVRMKYTQLTDELYEYVCRYRSNAHDSLLEQLRRETMALGEDSKMMISPEQTSFMTILVSAIGAKNAIEVGTFTGSSSIAIARGLPADGK